MRPERFVLEGLCIIHLTDANIFIEIELKQKRLQNCRAHLMKVRDGEIYAITTNFIVDTVSILMDMRDAIQQR